MGHLFFLLIYALILGAIKVVFKICGDSTSSGALGLVTVTAILCGAAFVVNTVAYVVWLAH